MRIDGRVSQVSCSKRHTATSTLAAPTQVVLHTRAAELGASPRHDGQIRARCVCKSASGGNSGNIVRNTGQGCSAMLKYTLQMQMGGRRYDT